MKTNAALIAGSCIGFFFGFHTAQILGAVPAIGVASISSYAAILATRYRKEIMPIALGLMASIVLREVYKIGYLDSDNDGTIDSYDDFPKVLILNEASIRGAIDKSESIENSR